MTTIRGALTASLCVLAGSIALAQEGDAGRAKEGEDHFQQMKQEILAEVDAHLDIMQKFRACVASAADGPGMRKCREEREAAEKAYMRSKKQERLKRIDEQQKKLDEEKQKIEKESQ
jgi:hypothetical protein